MSSKKSSKKSYKEAAAMEGGSLTSGSNFEVLPGDELDEGFIQVVPKTKKSKKKKSSKSVPKEASKSKPKVSHGSGSPSRSFNAQFPALEAPAVTTPKSLVASASSGSTTGSRIAHAVAKMGLSSGSSSHKKWDYNDASSSPSSSSSSSSSSSVSSSSSSSTSSSGSSSSGSTSSSLVSTSSSSSSSSTSKGPGGIPKVAAVKVEHRDQVMMTDEDREEDELSTGSSVVYMMTKHPISPRDLFGGMMQQRLQHQGTSPRPNLEELFREQGNPPPAVSHSEASSELVKLLENLPGNYWDLEKSTKKGCHGLKLTTSMCPDLGHAMTFKTRKVRENLVTVLRKTVRIVAAVNQGVRERLLDLSKPGQLFRLIVEGRHYQLAVDLYSSTNEPSSVYQYMYLIRSFIETYWNQHRTKALQAFAGTDQNEVQDMVAQATGSLQVLAKTAKRDVKHGKHLKQELSKKLEEKRIPKIEHYTDILAISHEFLMTHYSGISAAVKSGDESKLFDPAQRKFTQRVQYAMWSIRMSYLFNDDAQRRGMYESIGANEFYLVLLKCEQGRNGEPIQTELARAHLEPKILGNLEMVHYIRNQEPKDSNLKAVVRRISPRVDKRIRDKDNLWMRWNLLDRKYVGFVVHYFMTLRPKMEYLATKYGLEYNTKLVFLHTDSLKPLSCPQLMRDKMMFYNHYAAKKIWVKLPQTAGATVWRHAFATHEFNKYETKKDYQWCQTKEEAARIIAYLMNSSVEEVLTTYSTRVTLTRVPAGTGTPAAAASARPQVFELTSSEDDDEVQESPTKRHRPDNRKRDEDYA